MKANKELVITVSGKDKESSSINKRITKHINSINKLKQKIQNLVKTINKAQALYDQHCVPVEEKMNDASRAYIKKLYQRINEKSFSAWQKDLMSIRMMNAIEELQDREVEPGEELLEILAAMNEKEFEAMRNDPESEMAKMSKELLKEAGIEVGDDFDLEAFIKDEKYRKEFTDQHNKEQFEQDYEESKAQHQKIKEQKTKETNHDFHKLYKSLVKKAHPDLVSSKKEKAIREEWMKKLSQAWEYRNYYELLKLHQEINNGNAIDVTINESQLDPLLDQLSEEQNKLNEILDDIRYNDPETAFYYENFNSKTDRAMMKKINNYNEEIKAKTDSILLDIEALRTQKTTKALLSKIKESQNRFNYPDIVELFFNSPE